MDNLDNRIGHALDAIWIAVEGIGWIGAVEDETVIEVVGHDGRSQEIGERRGPRKLRVAVLRCLGSGTSQSGRWIVLIRGRVEGDPQEMLPLLAVCLLPCFLAVAVLVVRGAFNALRTRYGPFPSMPMFRVVALARPADVETPKDVPDAPSAVDPPTTKQPLEYLLAFDVEATCVQGWFQSSGLAWLTWYRHWL